MKKSVKFLSLLALFALNSGLLAMDGDQQPFRCKVAKDKELLMVQADHANPTPDSTENSIVADIIKAHKHPIKGFFSDHSFGKNQYSKPQKTSLFMSVDAMGTVNIWDFSKKEPLVSFLNFSHQIQHVQAKALWEQHGCAYIHINFAQFHPENVYTYKITLDKKMNRWEIEHIKTSPLNVSVSDILQTITNFQGTLKNTYTLRDANTDYLVAASENGSFYSWELN